VKGQVRGAAGGGALPHPVPYQGSKRRLVGAILGHLGGRRFERLVEPFAGSAAVSLAAASRGLARSFVLGDTLRPLVDLWRLLLTDPGALADGYEALWSDPTDRDTQFARVREDFNREGGAARLLYLLARCVKNAPRFNASGAFNQSPDRRRAGTDPRRMRRSLRDAHGLLAGRTAVFCDDHRRTLSLARPTDLVYLDPPWQGTSSGRDRRYWAGLDRASVVAMIEDLNERNVPFLLSYDGRLGDRDYGPPLPAHLARRLDLPAGRSSQATLLGRQDETVESLYLSPLL
jgi:DNA adenine methylase